MDKENWKGHTSGLVNSNTPTVKRVRHDKDKCGHDETQVEEHPRTEHSRRVPKCFFGHRRSDRVSLSPVYVDSGLLVRDLGSLE